MVSIDVEKVYDRVFRDLLWWVLEKKGASTNYIDVMYNNVVFGVRTIKSVSSEFSISIGLHQGSTLSPYLFILIINELTSHLHDRTP